jgi:hypothetical protein
VGRPAGTRRESLRIGRLVKCVDGNADPVSHALRERVGCDEHRVVALVQIRPRQLRVADLPEEADRAGLAGRLVKTQQVEHDVIGTDQRMVPGVTETDACRPSGAAQRVTKGLGEVGIGDARMGGGDADPDARRAQPAIDRIDD